MGAKRALIVDDSKSARTFLSRILEKYDLEVDSAENAEDAIEYLTRHRPDVIFMDHLMPGMDGFQAVQAIKNNPRTAMIPILMYTSQEGELYLGQARALGAVGVLPKQIRPTDVSKVLYQLHLVPDRRTGDQSSFRPVAVSASEAREADTAVARPLTDAVLREHLAELRRVLVANLDSQAERVTSDVRMILGDAPAAPAGKAPAPVQPPWAWIVAAAAMTIAVVSFMLWYRAATSERLLAAELAQLHRALAADARTPAAAAPGMPGVPSVAGAAGAGSAAASQGISLGTPAAPAASVATAIPVAAVSPARKSAVSAARPIVEPVPFGADPFGGPRLELLRQLFDRLSSEHVHGTVEIRTFPGRFCLTGNAVDGFSLAPDDAAFSKCDAVGNSTGDDALTQPGRMSVALANLVDELRASSHGAITVQVLPGDASANVVAYPSPSDSLSAGEWNRAGAANNRIEIRVR